MEYPKILEFNGEEYIQVFKWYYRASTEDINNYNFYVLYKYCFDEEEKTYGLSPIGFIDEDSEINVEYDLRLVGVRISNSIINSNKSLSIYNTEIDNSNIELYNSCDILHSYIMDANIKGKIEFVTFSDIKHSNLETKDKIISHSSIKHYRGTIDTHTEYKKLEPYDKL